MATAIIPPPRLGEKAGVSFAGCTHWCKLRQNWKASERLRVELGLDYDIKQNVTKPWAGVRLQLDGKPDSWAVEVNTDWGVLCTPTVDLFGFTNRLSLPVDLRVGKDFYLDGKPHVDIGVHNPAVAVAVVLCSLASKKPIVIKRKECGALVAALPLRFKNGREVPHQAQGRAEVDATLQRAGRGVHLAFHQVNAVLRLRQN